MLTTADLHYGRTAERIAARAATMSAACLAHPERSPTDPQPHSCRRLTVWINKPNQPVEEQRDTILIVR